MARQPFQGLFQGPSVGDVMSLRNKERDTRIRQAFADSAGAGGGFFANRMAKLAQQQQEAIRGAGQHIGSYFAPGLINEDPRLTKARKRDTDKVEIQEILGKFTDLSSDGGPNITEKELQIGFSELMKRGYPEEARKFLADSQSLGMMRLKEREVSAKENTALSKLHKAANAANGMELKFEGPVMKAKDGSMWQSASPKTFKIGTTPKPIFMKLSGAANVTTYDPVGAVVVDTKGQTFVDRVDYTQKTTDIQTNAVKLRERYKIELAKGKDKAQAFLTRRTEELKSKLGISADKAKQRAGAELITEREYIKGGILATEALPKAEELLEIVSSGDYTGGAASAAFKNFKRLFNIEGTDDAAFSSGTQMMLLKLLKPLMGAKATDQDLIELKKALANPAQSTAANKIILERFVKKMKKDKKAAKYFSSDSDATLGGWFQKVDQFAQLGTIPTPQAQRRVGEMIRKNGEAYKWNGSTWDKQ